MYEKLQKQGECVEELFIALYPHNLGNYKNSGSETKRSEMCPLGPISASLDAGNKMVHSSIVIAVIA
jgi:hypothetical protein